MQLIRDGVFKRNIHGYMEYTRIQLYTTHLRQVPMYVVYMVHNDEFELPDVVDNGHWFLAAENAAKFVKDVVTAWVKNTDCIPSIDITEELVSTLRDKVDEFTDTMYRVVFRDPISEIPVSAMASMPYNHHQPLFVSAESHTTAKYNIYPKHLAMAIACVNATMSHKGYVNDRIRHARDGAHFAVESAPYHPSGIPQDGAKWFEVESYPVWNKAITISFTPDMTDVCYEYVMPSGDIHIAEPKMLNAILAYDRKIKGTIQ